MTNQFVKVFDFEDGQLLLKKSRSAVDLAHPFEIIAIIQFEQNTVQFEPELVRNFARMAERDDNFNLIGETEALELYETLERMGNDFLKQEGFEMN